MHRSITQVKSSMTLCFVLAETRKYGRSGNDAATCSSGTWTSARSSLFPAIATTVRSSDWLSRSYQKRACG